LGEFQKIRSFLDRSWQESSTIRWVLEICKEEISVVVGSCSKGFCPFGAVLGRRDNFVLSSPTPTDGTMKNQNMDHFVIQFVFVGSATQEGNWNKIGVFTKSGSVDVFGQNGVVESRVDRMLEETVEERKRT